MKKHSRGSKFPAHPLPARAPFVSLVPQNGECIVPILKKRAELNRRKHLRFPVHPRLARLRVALQGTGRDALRPIRGQIHDFGTGGFSILVNRRVRVSHIFRGMIPYPDLPLAIPTLLQVRWGQHEAKTNKYLIGLQFLP